MSPAVLCSPVPCPPLPLASLAEVVSATICSRASCLLLPPPTALSFTNYCDNRGREINAKPQLRNNSEQTEGSCPLACQQKLDVRLVFSSEILKQNALDIWPSLQGPSTHGVAFRAARPPLPNTCKPAGTPGSRGLLLISPLHSKAKRKARGGSVLKATQSLSLWPQESPQYNSHMRDSAWGGAEGVPAPATAQWDAL